MAQHDAKTALVGSRQGIESPMDQPISPRQPWSLCGMYKMRADHRRDGQRHGQ